MNTNSDEGLPQDLKRRLKVSDLVAPINDSASAQDSCPFVFIRG
jgi:hypothetical protein